MRGRNLLGGLLQLLTSPFARHVATLAGGTALAQLLTLLVAPLLTRIYAPADFGVFALFVAAVTSALPAICGRFEIALVIAPSHAHSKQALGLALLIATFFSLSLLLVIVLFWKTVVAALGASALGGWFMVIPFALFLNGVILTFTHYANRLNEYDVISRSRLLNAVVVAASSIVLGAWGYGPAGLVSGIVLGLIFTSMWLSHHYRPAISLRVLAWNTRKRAIIRRYRDLPIYNATTSLLEGATAALPVFFLTRHFPESVVGFYALLLRAFQGPLSFLSASVAQVYLKKASELVNQRCPVRPYLMRLTLVLGLVVTPFSVGFILVAPEIFAWVFGAPWREAGVFAQILVPALALRFVVSSVSTTFGGTGNNRLSAVWKLTAFIVTALMYTFLSPRLTIYELLLAMLIMDITLYLFHYSLIWRAAGNPRLHR